MKSRLSRNPFRPNKMPDVLAVWSFGLNITKDGSNKISSWKSLKGAYNAAQSNASLRPTYDLPDKSVTFIDNEHLFDGGNTMNLTSGYGFYIVRKLANLDDRQGVFSVRTTIGSASQMEIYWQNTTGAGANVGNRGGVGTVSGYDTPASGTLGEHSSYQIIAGSDLPASSLNVTGHNNIELSKTNSFSNNLIPDSAAFPYIGLGFGGNDPPGPAYLDGSIRSIVVVDDAFAGLSDARNVRLYEWQKTQL